MDVNSRPTICLPDLLRLTVSRATYYVRVSALPIADSFLGPAGPCAYDDADYNTSTRLQYFSRNDHHHHTVRRDVQPYIEKNELASR